MRPFHLFKEKRPVRKKTHARWKLKPCARLLRDNGGKIFLSVFFFFFLQSSSSQRSSSDNGLDFYFLSSLSSHDWVVITLLPSHLPRCWEADGMLCSVNPPIQNTSVQIASKAFIYIYIYPCFLLSFFFVWAALKNPLSSARHHITLETSAETVKAGKSDPPYMRIFR